MSKRGNEARFFIDPNELFMLCICLCFSPLKPIRNQSSSIEKLARVHLGPRGVLKKTKKLLQWSSHARQSFLPPKLRRQNLDKPMPFHLRRQEANQLTARPLRASLRALCAWLQVDGDDGQTTALAAQRST